MDICKRSTLGTMELQNIGEKRQCQKFRFWRRKGQSV
uniref:(California timema) hypothetical protein n=1 Tax=Timema californicum TaxID=61474 RepID=A0A7R9JI27_TIMCA|nr:unnamed protein product [Timema californicum]